MTLSEPFNRICTLFKALRFCLSSALDYCNNFF